MKRKCAQGPRKKLVSRQTSDRYFLVQTHLHTHTETHTYAHTH